MPVPPSGSPLPPETSKRFQPASPAGTRCRSTYASTTAPAAGLTDPAAAQPAPHRAVSALIPIPSTEPVPRRPGVEDPSGRDHASPWTGSRPSPLTPSDARPANPASSHAVLPWPAPDKEVSTIVPVKVAGNSRSPGASWCRAQDQRSARFIITGDRQHMKYGPPRRNSTPGAIASPGLHPGGCASSTPVGVFTPVPAGQLQQSGPVELAGLCRRHPARGDSHQRRRASALLQMRALAEYGARPVLG